MTVPSKNEGINITGNLLDFLSRKDSVAELCSGEFNMAYSSVLESNVYVTSFEIYATSINVYATSIDVYATIIDIYAINIKATSIDIYATCIDM
jgi:hypothetical protein